VQIFSDIRDNPFIWENDPDYVRGLRDQPEHIQRAWLNGDWDIVAGGMFDDIWRREVHVVEPFGFPLSWKVDRCHDWGSAAPYATLWVAESDGNPGRRGGELVHSKPGDLFVVAEDYGWGGTPNKGCRRTAAEVAQRIVAFEARLQHAVQPGPADQAIFSSDSGDSIADEMGRHGVRWLNQSKGPGSRIRGAELMRQRLLNARNGDAKGLRFFATCTHCIRTIPVLPRDEKKPDDVDTDAEDHAYDAIRYKVMQGRHEVTQGQSVGLY
jgi:hypothetical protein